MVGLYLSSFERNVKTAWQDIQKNEDFCDITLACEGKQIKAHTLIISACSSVLRDILKSTQNRHPLIYLRKVKYTNLQNLLNLMYQGEVNVAVEDLERFLEIAKDFNLRGLSVGNMKSCNSNPSQFTHSNIDRSGKRNRYKEDHENMQNMSDSRPSESTVKYEQADDNFKDNNNSMVAPAEYQIETEDQNSKDNDNSMVAPTENQIETEDQNNEDTKQNIVSTLEVGQFICSKCDKQYLSSNGLKFHTKSVHSNIERSGKRYSYKKDYENIQILSDSQPSESPIKYEQADYIIKDNDKVSHSMVSLTEYQIKTEDQNNEDTKHNNEDTKHNNEDTKQNNEDTKYNNEDTNQNKQNPKQNIVSTLQARQFICSKCDKQYLSSNGLKFHRKSVHEGTRYSCEKCDYKATMNKSLRRHVKVIHEGEREYSCDQCDYEATRKEHLHRHQLKNHRHDIRPFH